MLANQQTVRGVVAIVVLEDLLPLVHATLLARAAYVCHATGASTRYLSLQTSSVTFARPLFREL